MGDRYEVLEEIIPDLYEKAYITYSVKCTAYTSSLSFDTPRSPDEDEVNHCHNFLDREFKAFDDSVTIVAMGNIALQSLVGKHEGVSKVAGKEYNVSLAGKTFRVKANYDPYQIKRNDKLKTLFKKYINDAYKKKLNFDSYEEENTWKILNPEEAFEYLDRTINLYKTGEISHTIFDLENSIGLEPWGGGEIIMISVCNDVDQIGYSIPLKVNNKNPHSDENGNNLLDFTWKDVEFDVSEDQRIKLSHKIGELLSIVPIVGHNIKYDNKWVTWKGVASLSELTVHDDTLNLAFQVFNKRQGKKNSLKGLCNEFLGADEWDWELEMFLKKFKRVKDRHFGNVPTGLLGKYAALDAYWNRELYNYLLAHLQQPTRPIANEINEANITFAGIENKGVAVDKQMLNFLDDAYTKSLEEIEDEIRSLPRIKKYMDRMLPSLKQKKKEVIEKNNQIKKENETPTKTGKKRKQKKYKYVPTDKELEKQAFNINSTQQLQSIIYGPQYYGLKHNKAKALNTKKGGMSTSVQAIEYFKKQTLADKAFENREKNLANKIEEIKQKEGVSEKSIKKIKKEKEKFKEEQERKAEARKFCDLLLKHRRMTKLKSTYVDPVPQKCHEGLYKPEYNLSFVTTGRLSSGFHTMPNECDIKRMFCSRWRDEGGLIFAADYSQIELRVIASMSGEQNLIDAYNKGIDVHTLTASKIYRVPLDQVTWRQRQDGKQTNFAIAYGAGAETLSAQLGVSKEEAQEMLNSFFRGYPQYSEWINQQHQFVKDHGFIVTAWNRIIPIPDSESSETWRKMEALRQSVNYPIQSSASDIVTSAINAIYKRLENSHLKSLVIAAVHDSIEGDTYPGELFHLMNVYKEECVDKMNERLSWLKCPLKIDYEIGSSWGGALESKVLESSDKEAIFECEGLRKDFVALKQIASRAYTVDYEIDTVKKPGDEGFPSFGDDIFIRDREYWEGKVHIKLTS